MITEPYRLIRHCEVTAILVLYGLPRYPSYTIYFHNLQCLHMTFLIYNSIFFYVYRLLTGSILAHEMMHAWLRLKGIQPLTWCRKFIFLFHGAKLDKISGFYTGYPNLSPEVEEGICQVLAHMWLESELYSGTGNDGASSSASSSSSSSPSSSVSTKKGKRSDFEKKLGEFFKHQIESDTSSAYGDGFRLGNQAMLKYGLKRTLDHIHMTGSFPY